jgi:uncharacterized protein (DUF608 family)
MHSKKSKSCSCKGGCSGPETEATAGLNRRDFLHRAAFLAGGAGMATASSPAAGVTPDDAGLLESARRAAYDRPDGAHPARYAKPIDRAYNAPYAGANLNRIAFPIGGIGAGMYCIEGTGALSHMSVRNEMEFFSEPAAFAAICVKGTPNIARVLEGPIPDWKYFGAPNTGNGAPGRTYGFPRFREAAFLARFPFATIELRDAAVPLDVTLTGWSPFLPGNADDSSLPAGALEYTFTNTAAVSVDAVFSFNSQNFMQAGSARQHGIAAFPNGFQLWNDAGPGQSGTFAVFADADNTTVDHCWFRGGWWDALTLAWRNVEEGYLLDNPPVEHAAPGASLFVPFTLAPGAIRTIRLSTLWYAGNTNLYVGNVNRPAFAGGAASGTAEGQQEVSGFLGKGLINSFYPEGDGPVGTLTSKPFTLKNDFIHFLIGGGGAEQQVGLHLVVDGKAVQKAAGYNTERLAWQSWDVRALKGAEATIQIVDNSPGGWGHINVDHIIFSDRPIAELVEESANALKTMEGVTLFEDFETSIEDRWDGVPEDAEAPKESFHRPWYSAKFENVGGVAAYWKQHYARLRDESARFRDTFHDTTLPPEVVEAVAANLTILKSPTVLRQADGRLWCWEGCSDSNGCCHGSCTHVWNYAQAIAHLFPELERSLRHTEYTEGLYESGQQAFRVNLPINNAPAGAVDASDGQLGGIIKMYREWRILGDTAWLRTYWPAMKRAMNYMIETWDPRETGLLEESHHNTYDINYFGPDGHCGSFYLAALTAFAKMGDALGEDTARYRALRDKGIARLESELYNGEYFFQKIMTEGLNQPPEKLNPKDNGPGYQPIVELLNAQGPKYQYGTGCLSDGILGFWMARVCGIDDAIADPDKVRSNLKAIHTHNLRRDLSAHANPQRPSYAMGNDGGLLLCTWPRGGALAIPFVYSNEVWTGIEYQVASHLMFEGMIEEGLEIVRLCRDRFDGVRRNPFNEYECGHWYARTMSSFGLLQGMTGVRYDAVEKTLYIGSRLGDFRAFLSTNTGYGIAGLKDGEPFLDVKSGTIEVRRMLVDKVDLG